jgi:HK97 family phage portal protein
MNEAIKTLSLNKFVDFLKGDGDVLPVERAYNEVGWFRRALDIRSDAVSRMPYAIYRGEQEIATEAPTDEIDPAFDIMPLLDFICSDLDMYGAFYALYETNQFNKNGAWRRLHPKTIVPQYDAKDGLTGFKRVFGNMSQMFELEDLLYVWMPNREAEVGHGKGLAHAALRAATALSNVEMFQGKFFEQGALNPTILTINNFQNYAEADQQRLRSLFERMMSGVKNAFRIVPVGEGVQAVNLMQPLRDMAMSELTVSQREAIATALGVPQSLLFSNATNFATATQDDINFYDKAIVPFIGMIERQLNDRLFKLSGYRLEFQPERLEVYQQLEATKVDKLSAMLDRNVIDIAEFRELMGLPERDDLTQPEQITVMPIPPQQLQADNQQDNSNDNEQTDDPAIRAAIGELKTWLSVAKKRMKEGNYNKAIEFTCEYIPAGLQGMIREQLSEALDADSIHAIFADAHEYMNHAGH